MSKKSAKLVFREITNAFNDPRIKQTIKFGSVIADSYAAWAENPTWWSAMRSGMNILKEIDLDREIWAYDFFDESDNWTEPFNHDFCSVFFNILKHHPYTLIKTTQEGLNIKIHEVEGIEFGYVLNTRLKSRVDKIYCKSNCYDLSRELLRKLLWKQFSGKSLVLKRSNRFGFDNSNEDKVLFEIDDTYQSMPSQRATEYSQYLKKCIDAGVNRSVMFYGPPGTGKSTTAKTIVETLGLRSFRIRVGDAGGIDTGTLFESVRIFQPDAIIFDDFDRAHNQENLLETLEHFHENVKLIIATVNRRDSLDEALLRPGRFDELEYVKRMDNDVVYKILGSKNIDVFEDVKEWPIAFIQEYVKRTQFMSKEGAINSVKELAARVDRLSSFDDDSGHRRVLDSEKKTT